MLMVDVLTAGFSALEAHLPKRRPSHPRPQNHARGLHKGSSPRISMLTISRLVRLAGGTNLHTGSYVGKMSRDVSENDQSREALRWDCYGLKRVFSAASGGVHQGKVAGNLDGYGIDCIVQAGGGVHGHPDGTTAGARAMIQAVRSWTSGVSIQEYAQTHGELKRALGRWGLD
ncbi:MAG: Ribulose bisphosphate carboxylase [Methanosaeta sp. PtaB.Bin039]|nr:MAG: Ribulose bisphosphate carboxylase [Methanosaeta sp. PtaB.Bin039]